MKTLLFDLNNLMMRNLFNGDVGASTETPDYNLWKFLIFDQIYQAFTRFKDINEVILAIDDKESWRKLLFSRYKESRKKKRSTDVDFKMVFDQYHKFCNDIKSSIPFKVIKIRRAEADDVIAILSKHINNNAIIMSNDQDFIQLIDGEKIKLYNPVKSEYITINQKDKENKMNKLFLTGQAKDDIFNVKTPNDYPTDYRKPPLGEKTADKIIEQGLAFFLLKECELKKGEEIDSNGKKTYKYHRLFLPEDNFIRNKSLIDFSFIPVLLSDIIKKKYDNYELPDPNNMYRFFMDNGWTGYLDNYSVTENKLLKLY